MALPKTRLEVWTPGRGRVEVRDLSHPGDEFALRPVGCQFPNLWEARGCDRCPRQSRCQP